MRASASSPRSISFFSSAAGSRLGVARILGLLGELADHRQHRPFDGPAHGAVGGVARGAEGAADRGRVEQPGLAERLGGAPQDLREDHARVAASAHQRRARELLRERRAVGGRRGVEHLHDRARGLRQVRARVAVRHGIDVQVVDAAAVRLERRERRRARAPSPARARSRRPPHVVDVHLDRRDRQPGQALDLVRDAGAHGRGDLGQVEPVLDDDVQIEPEPFLASRRPRSPASACRASGGSSAPCRPSRRRRSTRRRCCRRSARSRPRAIVIRPRSDCSVRCPRSTFRELRRCRNCGEVTDGLLHFARLEAAGADVGALGNAVQEDAHLLEVRVETATRRHHRVAPVVPERRLLAAGDADLGHRPRSLAAVCA